MEQASEKGASSWLVTTPYAKYGFNLHKQAFRDTLCLKYGWTPARLFSHCPCGHQFMVSHALSCSKGAMPTLQHNGIRDIFGQLLTEVCPNMGIEPMLQPLSGETYQHRSTNTEDGARLDIRAQNIWDKSQRSIYMVSGPSTPMPPLTARPPLMPVTKGTGRKRGGHMRSVSWRWSMGHSHHWCGLQVEAVGHLPWLPSG